MTDILIIEDSADIARGLRDNLEVEGYEVDIASDGEQGLARVRGQAPKLVILDLMLPRLDGIQVLRRLRDEGFEMPVLILSARAGEAEKVRGFRIGADDYVTKPFGLRELLARVDALFRRRRRLTSDATAAPPPPPARFGEFEIRFESRTVLKHGSPVALRPREFDLLAALARRANTGRHAAESARRGLGLRRRRPHTDRGHACGRTAPKDRGRPGEPALRGDGAQSRVYAANGSCRVGRPSLTPPRRHGRRRRRLHHLADLRHHNRHPSLLRSRDDAIGRLVPGVKGEIEGPPVYREERFALNENVGAHRISGVR